MSLAIDAVILFSAVILIWLGAKRGFIRSVMGVVSGIASIFVAYAYTPVLSEYIKKNYLLENITEGISETLRSLALDTETDLYNLHRLAEDLPEPFTAILERYRIDINAFVDQLYGLDGCGEDVVDAFAAQIAAPTTGIIASVIAFALIFFAVQLVLAILTGLLDAIFTLPVLGNANMLLGVVLGVAEAAIVASLLATVLSVLVNSLGAVDPGKFGTDVVKDTIICRFVLEHNLLGGLMHTLGWG